jgi:hypothetical protein
VDSPRGNVTASSQPNTTHMHTQTQNAQRHVEVGVRVSFPHGSSPSISLLKLSKKLWKRSEFRLVPGAVGVLLLLLFRSC